MAETKQCEQCQMIKPIDQFYRHHSPEGRRRICIDCCKLNRVESKCQEQERQARWEREQAEEKRRRVEESQRIQASFPTLLPGGTKRCANCNQEFPVNERGCLVVPFFDMHSSICEHCGKPLTIEYNEDGSISYRCQGHVGGYASSTLYGHSPKYCPYCNEKRRNERTTPCCVCQQKKGPALNTYHEYHLWGGGTAIRLYCDNRDCEKAFMALPASHQAFYIRSRCDLAFPPGQVIYALIDPEIGNKRYIGRTHTPSKRLNKHLGDRSDVPALFGPHEKPYYSRPNWMHDLYCRGLYPTMEIVKQVEIAPTVIEWEKRYILHGFQQGWQLVNIESAMDDLIAHAKASTLDFLNAPFEDLVRENFFRKDGIEAFIRAYYR
jgi:hypothetical protein